VIVTDSKFVLAAGAVYSAVLLLASADHKHPRGLSNSSDQVGRNLMMHNNAHIVAIDLNRHNDVTFQKTLSINDWYLNGGDGFRLGTMQEVARRDETLALLPEEHPLKSDAYSAQLTPIPPLECDEGRGVSGRRAVLVKGGRRPASNS